MRRYILFATALIALLGGLVAVFATVDQRDYQLRGYVDPTKNFDIPFHVPKLGVNAELTQYAVNDLPLQFDRMRRAHITWVHQFFRWDEIEPEQGVYQWEKWDAIVQVIAADSNLKLIAVLINSPQWAHQPNDKVTTPPNDPIAFADFARIFANRYGQAVDYYQIWDEPNLRDAWGGLNPRPSQYAAMLQAAYNVIHAADESATVIAAALAPTTEEGPQNISDLLYLRDLYALGAKDYMDAISAKPYGFDLPPTDRTVDNDTLNFSRVIALREEMLRNGDGAKAIWASNWGWNSLPDNWTGQPSIWGHVSAEQQIQYTLAALDRAEREWPWMAGMILHHWQPDAAADDPVWGFSLLDTPLYEALEQHSQPSAAENGLFFAANPYVRYSGVWTFSDLGADIGWINDSQLEFNFTGRDVGLLLRQNNYVAHLYPTIDGQQANALPKDPAGNAYILLTSDTLLHETNLVPVARNLNLSPHTLRVVASDLVPDDAKDRWALVGYAVSSGDLTAPYNQQITVAWLAVLVAAVATLVTGWRISWKRVFSPVVALWHGLSGTGQLVVSAITSLALMVGMMLTWNDATPALFRRESVQLGFALITAGIIYIEPGLLIAIIALLILFVIIYNQLDFGLMLTIFWSPFFLFPVELYRFAFPIAEIIVLLTGAAWLLRLLADWGHSRQATVSQFLPPSFVTHMSRLTLLDVAVIAWLALGFLSISWAAHLPQAITELRVMMIEPVLFYVVMRSIHLDKKAALRLVDALLLAGFVVSVVGFWLFIQGEATITAEAGARRLASVYGSPNNVGLFLGRCIPFALAFVIVKTDQKRRLFAIIILLVMGLAVVLSQSAGALFIGVPVAIAAVFVLSWGRRAWLAVLALAGVAVAAFIAALQSARFARLLDFSNGTNFARIRVWQSALNIIRDYPLTGIGLDQFLYAFQGRYIMPDAWQEPNLSHPHNFILDFWVRLGLFGVLVFLWIQSAFWRAAFRAYMFYRARDSLYFALTVGVMGSMINLLSHGLVDNSIYVQDLSFVFVFLLGLAAHLSNTGAIDE